MISYSTLYPFNRQYISQSLPFIIIFILVLFVQYHIIFIKEKINFFQKRLFNKSLLLVLLSVAFLYSGVIILIESTNSIQFLMVFLELFAIVSLLYSISKEYIHTQKSIIELQNKQQLIQLKTENQEAKANNDIEIMHIRHEIKNQILTIDYLIKEEKYLEVADFIKSIYSEPLYKKTIDTNNEVINAICNNKVYHYPNIQYHFDIQFSNLNIDNHELISLVGNALDNAIEHVLTLKKEERNIFVTIQQTNDYYVIIIKNNVNTASHFNEKNIATTKKDKNNHGFGIKIMQDIISKHGGTFKAEIEDKYFIVSMLIPINIIIG